VLMAVSPSQLRQSNLLVFPQRGLGDADQRKRSVDFKPNSTNGEDDNQGRKKYEFHVMMHHRLRKNEQERASERARQREVGGRCFGSPTTEHAVPKIDKTLPIGRVLLQEIAVKMIVRVTSPIIAWQEAALQNDVVFVPCCVW
jgi:hypothetical protein